MGHAARRNETAQAAGRGELLSRQSILGAMDHALELHAAALRLLEAKIVALKERIEKLEIMLHVPPSEALTREVPDVPTAQTTIVRASMSAQPCGCDAGIGWLCERHRCAHDGAAIERDGLIVCQACGYIFRAANVHADR